MQALAERLEERVGGAALAHQRAAAQIACSEANLHLVCWRHEIGNPKTGQETTAISFDAARESPVIVTTF